MAMFGTSLPARIGESAGSTVDVDTVSELNTQLSSASYGTIIRIVGDINYSGSGDCTWSRAGSSSAVTMVTADIPTRRLYNCRFNITGGYLRLRGFTIEGESSDCTKATVTANNIEWDRMELRFAGSSGNLAQGCLAGAGASNMQMWNCVVHDNGLENPSDTLGHGVYWGNESSGLVGTNVIANCLMHHPQAYNLHFYPAGTNTTITGCTFEGGITRGGVLYSGTNLNMYHSIISNTPGGEPAINNFSTTDCTANDTLTYNTSGIQTGSELLAFNCPNGNPQYISSGSNNYRLGSTSSAHGFATDTARHGYLVPLDLDGASRVLPSAGCYSLVRTRRSMCGVGG